MEITRITKATKTERTSEDRENDQSDVQVRKVFNSSDKSCIFYDISLVRYFSRRR